jgi:dynein intermediate chain 3, axonemal
MTDNHISHESKQKFYSSSVVATPDNLDDDENIFDGEYEEYKEKSFYADLNFETKLKPTYEYNSIVKNKRQQLFKIIITRPKKEFESTYQFVDKAPGEENSGDIKNSLKNEFLTNDRAYLEIGLQTANDSNVKSYQVPKKITKNAFTQVEPGMKDVIDQIEYKKNLYFKNQNKLNDIENFLNKVRSMMEQALQSNETIDIFQNDFDLDRNTMIKTDEEKKDKDKIELRSFRDASAGPKIKKEKSVNYIRFLLPNKMYMAHSLLRNLSFEEKAKVLGIPYPSQILIWDLKNPEATAPIFFLEIPMEITCFEFCPTNLNKLVCGLYSGQLIFYEFDDFLGELEKAVDSESTSQRKSNFKLKYAF